jgi:hypothetical protein
MSRQGTSSCLQAACSTLWQSQPRFVSATLTYNHWTSTDVLNFSKFHFRVLHEGNGDLLTNETAILFEECFDAIPIYDATVIPLYRLPESNTCTNTFRVTWRGIYTLFVRALPGDIYITPRWAEKFQNTVILVSFAGDDPFDFQNTFMQYWNNHNETPYDIWVLQFWVQLKLWSNFHWFATWLGTFSEQAKNATYSNLIRLVLFDGKLLNVALTSLSNGIMGND